MAKKKKKGTDQQMGLDFSRKHEKHVKEGYRPRTKALDVGDSKTKEGARDPKTGRRKRFYIKRVG